MAMLATQQSQSTDGRRVRLTKNDRLVLSALEEAGAPLKAYDLLERLKAQGIGAPMTVYRALDRLQKQGLVHKLDGLGAFMVCMHGGPHDTEIFMICERCESVTEVRESDGTLEAFASRAAEGVGFKPGVIRMEIRGTCARCP